MAPPSPERPFVRPLRALALGVGLLIAVLPPLVHRSATRTALAARAADYAERVATSLEQTAVLRQYAWKAHPDEVWSATAAYERAADVIAVRLLDPRSGTPWLQHTPLSQDTLQHALSARATAQVDGKPAAQVEVWIEPAGADTQAERLLPYSALLGALVGVALYRLAAWRLRAPAEALEDTIESLRAAEGKQRQVSSELTQWMTSAVREVRDLSERVVQIQEDERGRIARDLHDSVGQQLTALHLELELVDQRPAEAGERLRRSLRACEDALADLRRVVYDLRPPELAVAADLAEVLRSYTERFELRTGLPTSFRAEGGTLHSEEIATCLLRVLQEALTNVSRHAAANEIGVALTLAQGKVSMEVSDDGRGFEVQAPRRGTGLRGIHERCAFLGGSVEVDSGPQSGTRLRVHLPIADRDA